MSGELEFTFESPRGYTVETRVVLDYQPGVGWAAKIYGPLQMRDDQPVRPILCQLSATNFGHIKKMVEDELPNACKD